MATERQLSAAAATKHGLGARDGLRQRHGSKARRSGHQTYRINRRWRVWHGAGYQRAQAAHQKWHRKWRVWRSLRGVSLQQLGRVCARRAENQAAAQRRNQGRGVAAALLRRAALGAAAGMAASAKHQHRVKTRGVAAAAWRHPLSRLRASIFGGLGTRHIASGAHLGAARIRRRHLTLGRCRIRTGMARRHGVTRNGGGMQHRWRRRIRRMVERRLNNAAISGRKGAAIWRQRGGGRHQGLHLCAFANGSSCKRSGMA